MRKDQTSLLLDKDSKEKESELIPYGRKGNKFYPLGRKWGRISNSNTNETSNLYYFRYKNQSLYSVWYEMSAEFHIYHSNCCEVRTRTRPGWWAGDACSFEVSEDIINKIKFITQMLEIM